MHDKIQIHFLGAAGTVTGSKFLIKALGKNILVDCGLFQGIKKLRLLNWQFPPIEISEIDIVLLTHAHLDHSGYLPRLVKMGFNGNIWGTGPSLDIATIILKDSAKIQEEEADRANRNGYSSHKPAKPLYDMQDVERTVTHFHEIVMEKWLDISEGIRVQFRPNGHILGATFIEMDIQGKRIVFSGDIGRDGDLLLESPQRPEKADILLLESTYGDRLHPHEDVSEKLKEVIDRTHARGGTLIIPSFSVERNQLLMYLLWQLKVTHKILPIPVYMDSPMGTSVLDVFHRNPEWHKLSIRECEEMCKEIHLVREYKETLRIADNPKPKIIIAGSGMVTGGRVLTYLTQYIQRPETTVLLVGFQAEGTRGRQLLDGVAEVKIYGQYYPVNAEILSLKSMSSHADQKGLIEWVSNIKESPEQVFLIHGEAQAADVLRVKLTDTFGWNVTIPELYSIEEFSQ